MTRSICCIQCTTRTRALAARVISIIQRPVSKRISQLSLECEIRTCACMVVCITLDVIAMAIEFCGCHNSARKL
jgi:hypothetical protein